MSPDAKKKLIGALIAAGLAIAVYYGLIDQKQADNIRTQTDQTLGTGPARQPQTAPPTTPTSAPGAPQQGSATPPTTPQNAPPPAAPSPAPAPTPPH